MKNILKLYVIRNTASAAMALDNICSACKEAKLDDWDIEVIDILENPHLAEQERVIAVPTLIKKLPPPARRFVGDLSNKEQILLSLDIVTSQ